MPGSPRQWLRRRIRPPKPQSIKAKPNSVNTDDGEDSGQRHSEAPSLPADLGKWEEQDFLQARDKGDPRLAAAVEQLAKHPRGTAAEAEMLATIVKQKPPAGSEAFAAPARGALVRAVTTALAANNTDTAGKSLGNLFVTEFSASERQATADIVLTALLRQESPEREQVVLKILAANLPTVASVQDEQPADSLLQKIIAVVARTHLRGCERRWQMRFWSKPHRPRQANSIYPCYASRIR